MVFSSNLATFQHMAEVIELVPPNSEAFIGIFIIIRHLPADLSISSKKVSFFYFELIILF